MFVVRRNKVTFRPFVSDQSIVLNTLPLAYDKNTIDLETRQAEDRPGEEGIGEMSSRDGRTSDLRLKVNESHS